MEGRPQMIWGADSSRDLAVVRFPQANYSLAEKAAYRRYCRAHMVCVVDACRAQLNANFRKTKISGYSHAKGTANEHASERIWHQMGKQIVARWAILQGAQARIEECSGDATRRPDVTITTPSDVKIAVEVQYASMTYDAYISRHEDHRRQYAISVWLLGDGGDNLRHRQNGDIKLNQLAQAIRDHGDTLLWLNASAGTVMTVWDGEDEFGHVPATGAIATSCDVVPIEDCCQAR